MVHGVQSIEKSVWSRMRPTIKALPGTLELIMEQRLPRRHNTKPAPRNDSKDNESKDNHSKGNHSKGNDNKHEVN